VKRKVQWWSSMLGKLSSVGVVVEALKKEGCRNWAVSEFVQGGRTRRWGVAWSWAGYRPSSSVARGVKAKALKGGASAGKAKAKAVDRDEEEHERLEGGSLPFPSEFEFELRGTGGNVEEAGHRVDSEISNLDLRWQWKSPLRTGLGIAQHGDCWSRKARRRQEHQTKEKRREDDEHMGETDEEEDEEDEQEQDKELEFAFKVHVRHPLQKEGDEGMEGTETEEGVAATVTVTVRWLQGQDHVLFESFCGWLKRKVSSC
jgi:23S rRNA (adenine1618-N6)-methyltransferase